MTRVLLIRGADLRHQALATVLSDSGLDVVQVVQRAPLAGGIDSSPLILQHWRARSQAEIDMLGDLIVPGTDPDAIAIPPGRIDDIPLLHYCLRSKPDYVVTFGCAMLSRPWISALGEKTIGVHLGLSPYYRGSGSNFFAFVDDAPGAVGYSLLSLDPGIDTGRIIHQEYAEFFVGDGIHSVGTRLMRRMFFVIRDIVVSHQSLTDAAPQPRSTARFSRVSDFSEEVLRRALDNINGGMVERFLANVEAERRAFPIIRRLAL